MSQSLLEEIEAHPLFRGASPELLEALAEVSRLEEFPAERYLLEEGRQAKVVYWLRKGQVVLELRAQAGKSLPIETIGPGSILGLSWLVGPNKWATDARALEPVRAVVTDAVRLLRLADEDKAFGYELARAVAEVMLARLQATRLRLLDIYGDVVARR